jgi:uncharacterized lipoprotein NlpE involved in copper resistance
MKRIFIFLFSISVIFVSGCNRSRNSSGTDITDNREIATGTEKSAKSAFDYYGSYFGVLPCADCEGIETEIKLNRDNTFSKKIQYLGKGDDQVFEAEGTFSWDESGNTIILEGIKDAPNSYCVTEGAITQLDMDGNVITGDLSAKYRLNKMI